MFDRLESAFARQVRFTADASHELRTPLSVIRSHAELALTRQRSADEYRKTIETCLRAAKRMSALVESLLVLARADAGRLELHRENFDLVEVINDCMEMIGPMAEERGITLERQLEPLEVNADRNRIAQLLTNLLTNAVRYNRDGGKIIVSSRREGVDAVISIADTGVGIAPIDQPRVFERFFRADPARSREAGGSGLGLAICQSIVEAHDGQVTFTSQQAQGTTFVVRLPVLVGHAQSPEAK
jgi:signal transduction histidine kinase